MNAHVINFYRQLKNNFEELKLLIDTTLHSRDVYEEALIIYHAPILFDELRRAWAFWVTTNMGYSGKIGTWGYDRSGKLEQVVRRRKEEFTDVYSERLVSVEIENNDANKVIQSRDNEQAFIYCDPPYVGSNQGHYGGYTQQHFDELLECLAGVNGRFLLSSYPNDELVRLSKIHGWYTKHIDMQLSSSQRKEARKVEVLTANFEIG